eukprot:3098701-Pleurochrysis_carterae.AAC.1
MPAGYAAERAARASPVLSLPCATSSCPSVPCVHRAARSAAPRRPCSARAQASVVYLLRTRAPNAHCANVACTAPACASAPRTFGSSHMGA